MTTLCDEWQANRNINPRTKRKIKSSGKVYKDLAEECSSEKIQNHLPSNKKRFSPKCIRWRGNPHVNPLSGNTIKVGGPTYRKLEKECGEPNKSALARDIIRPKNRLVAPTAEDCEEWRMNPDINPRTGQRIFFLNDLYNWYETNCQETEGTWFRNRLNLGTRVNEFLKRITSDQWDICMSGSKAPIFRENFNIVNEIGRGSFGQVYKASIPESNDILVVKEAYLKPDEKRLLKTATQQNEKWDQIEKKSYPDENRILDLVNNLLLNWRCPNFVYIYNMAMCDGCKVQRYFSNRASIGSCYVTFMEAANTDLHHAKLDSFAKQLSVLYQLLIAVYAIHRYYAIWHRDIKLANVFVSYIKPGGHILYEIGNKKYYVENTGIIVYLADFGVSEVLSPLYAFDKYYGHRNAEVAISSKKINDSKLYWKPITIQGNKTIKWVDSSSSSSSNIIKGTQNEITSQRINSSRPIDLNDSQKFPPFEFFDDIQDVIRMFVGGKQSAQEDNHKKLPNVDPILKDFLLNYAYLKHPDQIYQTHGTVKYILADEMLNTVYREPRSVDHIVNKFTMS